MSLTVGRYYKGNPKIKPQPWGAQADVRRGLLHHAEKLGINPHSLKIAYPAWEGGGLDVYNYALDPVKGTLENGAIFANGGVSCLTDTDVISTNLTVEDIGRGPNNLGTIGSFFFGYQKTVPVDDYYYWMSVASGAYFSLLMNPAVEDFKLYIASQNVHSDTAFGAKIIDGEKHYFGCSFFNSSPTKFALDGQLSIGANLTQSLASYTSQAVLFGGRGNATGRHCAGAQDNILMANEYWSEDTLQALTDNPYQLWQPYAPPVYFEIGEASSTVYTLDAESGSFTLTGTDADLLKHSLLSAGAGSLTLTGSDADLLKNFSLNAESGSFNLTGSDADLLKHSLLNAESGSLSLTGMDASLLKHSLLNAESGSFTLTGMDADLLRSYLLSAESGSFTLTGTSVDLLKHSILNAESGSFTLTGMDADLIYIPIGSHILYAETGYFTLTGMDADLIKHSVLSAESGSFTLTGTDADLLKHSLLSAESGSLSLTGTDINLLKHSILNAESGSFTLTGFPANLIHDPGSVPDWRKIQLISTVNILLSLESTCSPQINLESKDLLDIIRIISNINNQFNISSKIDLEE